MQIGSRFPQNNMSPKLTLNFELEIRDFTAIGPVNSRPESLLLSFLFPTPCERFAKLLEY